jgi:hypothetical protein
MTVSKRSSKVILTLGLALVLVAGGVATASNMGFKFVKNYGAVDPAINTVSLPYFQTQFTTAQQLFNDLGAQAVQVCRLNSNNTRSCWLGDFTGSLNFTLNNATSYLVGVSAVKTEVIVGSHDPSNNIGATFLAADPAIYLTSLPYHMTYTNLRDLFSDIPGAVQVCRLNSNNTRTCWLGDFTGSLNVTLNIGEGYLVGVNPAAPTWIPDHY